MGRIPIEIDGEKYWAERNGPKAISLSANEYLAPFGQVPIPSEYRGFTRRQLGVGKGSSNRYDHRVPWLVDNVPKIRESIRQQVALCHSMGV